MADNKLGLKDIPIEDPTDEVLGLGGYARVLSEFVDGCDTPITIALQGDWGSGKTSLMNLIRNVLETQGKRYVTVWFNTWQYAQFNMSDTLALSMMRHFVDALQSGNTLGKAAETALNFIGSIGKAAVVGAAGVVGQGDAGRAVVDQIEGRKADDLDPARALESLKQSLTKVVAERIKEPDTDKVVVFIDDLDRLVPAKAVELLESLKLFLDIDHCVYIIACDYKVVARGLKEKFGEEGDRKGKSFFDKIIQVPFKMPTRNYQTARYIAALLAKIDVPAEDQDVALYCNLVEHSVGFNPRTMKRMFNSLLLLTILLKRSDDTSAEEAARRDRCRVLFATLCLQERYEPLYDYLRQMPLTDELFDRLKNQLAEHPDLEDLRAKLAEDREEDDSFEDVREFMGAFYDAIQLDEGDDSREELSNTEQDHLQQMLTLTAVVSSSEGQPAEPREYAKELRKQLNERYRNHLGKGRPIVEKFRYTRGEESKVFFRLPAGVPASLVVWCSPSCLRFGLEHTGRTRKSRSVKLRAIAEHLYGAAEQPEPPVTEVGEKCVLFEASLVDGTEDAEDRFLDQMHALLDPIMGKGKIYSVCKAYGA